MGRKPTLGHVPYATIKVNKRRLALFAQEVMPHFRKNPVLADR